MSSARAWRGVGRCRVSLLSCSTRRSVISRSCCKSICAQAPTTGACKIGPFSSLKLQRLLAAKTTFSPFCTAGSNGEQEYNCNPEVDTSELAELVQKGDVQLIDVREPYEIEEMGLLAPNTINIPLDEVESALRMDAEQFEEKYNSPLPDKEDHNIVFYCMAGIRSLEALESAHQLGYKKARHYIRGWLGWEEYLELQNSKD